MYTIGGALPSKIAHVRLSEADFKFIDEAIQSGYFVSRSDFIKNAIRMQIYEISKRKLKEIARDQNQKLPLDELLRSAKESRRQVYREQWG